MTPNTARRRPVRIHFRDGIEAALRADPEALTACKPRTQLGVVVRALVQEAGRGKTTAVRQMLALLDWEEPEAEATEVQMDAESAADTEPQWDWDESGNWNFAPRETPAESTADSTGAREPAAQRIRPYAAEEEYFKNELRRRFAKLAEADAVEAVRRAKLNGAASHGAPPMPGPSEDETPGSKRN